MLGIKHIKTDGTIVDLKRRRLTLEDVQEYVGGYIEHVPIEGQGSYKVGKCGMYVNEEGLIHNLPLNRTACLLSALTTFLPADGPEGDLVENPIVGDVVIIEHEQSDFEEEIKIIHIGDL